MLYNPPTGSANPNAPYVGKDVVAGTQGSKVPKMAVEAPQRELVALITAAGLEPTNTDLAQVMKAIRGGQLATRVDTGTVNHVVVATPIAHGAVFRGLPLRIFPTTTNTGATDLILDGLPAQAVTRRDGSALQAGDIVAGVPFDVVHDGAGRFRIVGIAVGEVPRIVMSPTVWVRPDGNDNNDGSANTADKAYATIAGAATKGSSRFFLGGSTLTVQLGLPGTYAAPGNIAVGSNILIQGDAANKAGYIVTGAGVGSGSGVTVVSTGLVTFKGLTLQNTGAINWTLAAIGNGAIAISDTAFAITVGGNSYAHLLASGGGSISVGAGTTFSGSANSLWLAAGGTIVVNGVPVAITGTPNFPASTVKATDGGKVQFGPGSSFSGAATGPRYSVLVNAIINTLGGGENFIPGNSGGNILNGGQYV